MKSNKNIKKALNHEVPNWDDAAMWDQIEESLPQEKKRRRILWWLFTGITSIIVISLGFVMLQDNSLNLNNNTALAISTKSRNDKSKIKTNTTSTPVNITTQLEDEARKIDDDSIEEDPSHTAHQHKVNLTSTAPSNHSNSTIEHEIHQQPIQTLNVETVGFDTPPTILDISTKTNLDDLEVIKGAQMIGMLSFIPESGKKNNVRIPNILTYNNRSQFQSEAFSKIRSKQAVTLDFGIYNTHRSLIAPDYNAWVAAKNQQENISETVDLNLQYHREIYKNIQLGIGIGYSQVNEQIIWTDTLIAAIDTTYTTSIQTVKTTSNILQIETPNAYKTLYLPISIGYLKAQQKWTYGGTVGVDIALLSNYAGRFLSTDLEDLSIERSVANVTNKTIGLQSLTASINIGYRLRKRLFISAGLRGKMGLQNRLTDSNTQLKYHNYGVHLGLRYILD